MAAMALRNAFCSAAKRARIDSEDKLGDAGRSGWNSALYRRATGPHGYPDMAAASASTSSCGRNAAKSETTGYVRACLRFAAEMSLALRGLMSGASNISCSCSISSMMRSTSMRHNHLKEDPERQPEAATSLNPSVCDQINRKAFPAK